MYFYNYDDPGHALVRANYKTGGRKRESTGIPLTSEYKIFAWERNIYFVRYDAGENKLYAAVPGDPGGGERLLGARWQHGRELDQGEVRADRDVPEVLAAQAALVGDRADDLARQDLVTLAHTANTSVCS
jgi:hypothetical protein